MSGSNSRLKVGLQKAYIPKPLPAHTASNVHRRYLMLNSYIKGVTEHASSSSFAREFAIFTSRLGKYLVD